MKETAITLLLLFILGLLNGGKLLAQKEAQRAYREAEALREQNRCTEAIQRYNVAIKEDPKNYRYYLQRGRCEYRMNKMTAARYSLEQAVALGADEIPASVYYLLGKIHLNENPDNQAEAVKYYRKAADLETDGTRRMQYQLLLVQSLTNLQQYNEAQSYLNIVAKEAPENASVLYYQGQLAGAQGQWEAAKSYYEQALRSSELKDATAETRAKYYYGLGRAFEELGQEEEAKTAFVEANHGALRPLVAPKLQENTPAYHYKLAVSYYLGEEYQLSEEYLQRVFEVENNNANAYVLGSR
ncbi:MAG: tetratricopeptide repeat protein, partial [Bacteroidota bacterium]